mgnify:CR=1 FL=1
MAKKLIILGAGESGVGTALLAKQKGYDVFVSDGGAIQPVFQKELEDNQIEFESLAYEVTGKDLIEKMKNFYPEKNLLVTLGAAGAIIRTKDGEIIEIAAPKTEVIDTTGAGDGFVGAFAAALNSGTDMSTSLEFAIKFEAPVLFVCENNLYAESTSSKYHLLHESTIGYVDHFDIKAIKVDEFSPCSCQSGFSKLEPLITVKSGSKSASSSSEGRINIFLTKWACQATSITNLTLR